jgi:hypothetical protein
MTVHGAATHGLVCVEHHAASGVHCITAQCGSGSPPASGRGGPSMSLQASKTGNSCYYVQQAASRKLAVPLRRAFGQQQARKQSSPDTRK